MRTAIILPALLLAACDTSAPLIEHEYVYVQKRDSLWTNGPITYTVRLDLNGDTLIWRQRAVDADGEVAIGQVEFSCSIFDKDNFQCSIPQTEVTVTMKSGELTSNFFGPNQQLKRRTRILGYGF